MTVYIAPRPCSILLICLISVLQCLQLSSSIAADVENTTLLPPSTNDTDQTVLTAEPPLPVNEPIVADSTTTTTKNAPLDSQATPVENRSDTPVEISSSATTTPSPSPSLDNQNISTTTTTTAETPLPKKNLSNINSFEEWKQQQLQAEIAKRRGTGDAHEHLVVESTLSNPPTTSTVVKKGKRRKNFASASCGAKILAHNPEVQKPSSILSSSPDEYMLNPCNAKIWFVIELCESIRILHIEIANFELFSSVPKTFRVFGADRYPTKEWHRHPLGVFNATFNRTIQGFQTIESNSYLKYVKFELLDFHGHEHYCPLSVVRIHGSNVEDEIMTMEENTNGNDLKSSTNIVEENFNEEEENSEATRDQQVGGIIGSAILDLAKRVFRRQTVPETPSTTTVSITENNALKNNCHSAVDINAKNHSIDKFWPRNESFKRCLARFLGGFWSKIDPCIAYFLQFCHPSTICCQTPSHRSRSRQKSTLNIHDYPCGYFHLLTNGLICKKVNETQRNFTIHDELLLNASAPTMNKTNVGNISESISILINSSNETSINETTHPMELTRSNETNANHSIEGKLLNESSLNTTNSISIHNTSSISPLDSLKVDLNFNETAIDTMNHSLVTSALPNQNEPLTPLISSPWLKGMLVNTKSLPELFKIIEKLNFNLTLSNRYLQELSQHYVKKLDETQQTTDLLLKASNAADLKLKQYEDYLAKLTDNLSEMSDRLIKLEAWIPLLVCLLLFLLIWCFWSTYVLIHLRQRLQSNGDKSRKKSDSTEEEDEEEDLPVFCNGRKKRKFSTDSTDSSQSRSQRVPDSNHLPKIRENGHHSSRLQRRQIASK